jgi:hypothetical protein
MVKIYSGILTSISGRKFEALDWVKYSDFKEDVNQQQARCNKATEKLAKQKYKEGQIKIIKLLLSKEYKQLYNANTILLLEKIKHNIKTILIK